MLGFGCVYRTTAVLGQYLRQNLHDALLACSTTIVCQNSWNTPIIEWHWFKMVHPLILRRVQTADIRFLDLTCSVSACKALNDVKEASRSDSQVLFQPGRYASPITSFKHSILDSNVKFKMLRAVNHVRMQNTNNYCDRPSGGMEDWDQGGTFASPSSCHFASLCPSICSGTLLPSFWFPFFFFSFFFAKEKRVWEGRKEGQRKLPMIILTGKAEAPRKMEMRISNKSPATRISIAAQSGWKWA